MIKTSFGNFDKLQAQVITRGLCTRCGICAGVCPVNVIAFGEKRYPKLTGDCISCDKCNACCPGAQANFNDLSRETFGVDYNHKEIAGLVEARFVANAHDIDIRNKGTSGGVVTALLLHLLETKKINGAIVVGWSQNSPTETLGFLATAPSEIRLAAKSKYSLTPSMEVLKEIRNKPGKYAVVALPCQIQGLRKMKSVEPDLYKKIYCIIGLLCHHNMEPEVVNSCIKAKNIPPSMVQQFNFRAGAWPGSIQAHLKNNKNAVIFPVSQSTIINVLFSLFGAKRCKMCLDPMAGFADISVGDFWAMDYSGDLGKLSSSSLVYQRSKLGLSILNSAAEHHAIQSLPLPRNKDSIRILKMFRQKRNKSRIYMNFLQNRGESIPDYGMKAHNEEPVYFTFKFNILIQNTIRQKHIRMFILKVFVSPAGILIDKLNKYRKSLKYNFKAP